MRRKRIVMSCGELNERPRMWVAVARFQGSDIAVATDDGRIYQPVYVFKAGYFLTMPHLNAEESKEIRILFELIKDDQELQKRLGVKVAAAGRQKLVHEQGRRQRRLLDLD